MSFQCLEFALRAFLYERGDPPHDPLPQGTDLNTLRFGDIVTENAMTRWDSLTHLIKRFNRAINDPQLALDLSLVELRDALSHGRITASSGPNLALIKFTRPYVGRVEVGYREELTREWLTGQIQRVLAACQNVAKASASSNAKAAQSL